MRRYIFLLCLAVGLSLGSTTGQDKSVKQAGEKLSILLSYIDMLYVDPANIDKLSEAAVRSVLLELDPHSYYLSAEELEEANEELAGQFEGIGVQFQIHKDTILVISPITGGPSERVGIMAGDKIVEINGQNATGPDIDNRFVFDRLRGLAGTQVKVGIKRGRRDDILNYTITRAAIPVTTLDAVFMAAPGIGYIRINRFAQNTMSEFQESLKLLKKEGMKKLILDLRNNSGGYMHAAIDMVDQFMESNKLIVYTQGYHSPRQDFYSTWLGSFIKGEVVVMIDEGSASASEIVAGAVQDWDRGIVVGRRSFGKGLVQKQFPLNDGSAVRLTTARYYTPSGRSIQKPYENGQEDYFLELAQRFEHGEFVYADSIRFPDSLRYQTRGGRVVYGGGGIMPDIFVPWDSTEYTDLYAELIRTGVINDNVLEFIEENRSKLKETYPDIHGFKDFVLPASVISSMRKMADERQVVWSDKEYDLSATLIQSQLKALIARNLFDISAYFQVILEEDDAYNHALEALHNKDIWNRVLSQ